MLCNDGKISLYAYLGTIFSFCIIFLPNVTTNFILNRYYANFWAPFIFYVVTNILIKCFHSGHDFQVAIRAAFLGYAFAIGLYIFKVSPEYVQIFGIYMCVMSFFHYSEFLAIAIIQPSLLSTNSFLISHSLQYSIAAVTSWFEFAIESYFFPGLKCFMWISCFGLTVCVIGEFLRKLAMLTAHSNFNHLVQSTKADDHVLVTHGIYAYFRHPSYVGWFYWSIGTQIILINPICLIAYACASWFFFNERINIEEITLLSFFGEQYCDYQRKVGTGLPLIQGYRIRP